MATALSKKDTEIQDLLQCHGLKMEHVRKKCSEQVLKTEVAPRITYWKVLAPHLGMSEADEVVIDKDGAGEEDKRRRLLQKWLECNGNAATYYKLIEALINAKNKNTADKICKYLAGKEEEHLRMEKELKETKERMKQEKRKKKDIERLKQDEKQKMQKELKQTKERLEQEKRLNQAITCHATGGQRSVLLVGNPGAGISTVGNNILGRDIFRVGGKLGSVMNKVEHATAQLCIGMYHHDIMVFDTIGFFNSMIVDKELIVEAILTHVMEYSPDGINLMLFVLNKERFTEEEQATFEYITSKFGSQVPAISACVITHCDTEDDDERASSVKNFRTNSLTSKIAAFMEKGIYTVGFPNIDKMKKWALLKDDIERDRQQLLRLIASCEKKVHLNYTSDSACRPY